MTLNCRSVLTHLLLVTLSSLSVVTAHADSNTYRLGPQDKLEISVYDLRSGSGEVHSWVPLNGSFVIDANGSISFPLLGEVHAAGGSPGDLAKAITTRLQAKIGLAQQPDASVQVVKYRPFYIMGAVEKPGEYDFRPGLDVLQAISIAGGLLRASDENLLGYERESLTVRGDLRLLAAERTTLLLRRARLSAEIEGAKTIAFPQELAAQASDPDVKRAMDEENLMFESSREALASKIETTRQSKTLLAQELVDLAAKEASLKHQLDLTRAELAQVSGLVAKGLALSSRKLAAEQSTAAFESSRLDVLLATLRTQRDLTQADRDMIDINSKYRSDALAEATEVRGKLAASNEKLATARNLIYQSEIRAPMTISRNQAERQPTFLLTRRQNGASLSHSVSEGDEVRPGDVLRVLLPRPSAPGATAEAKTGSPTTSKDY